MPHAADVPRVFFALAFSGVFWLTAAIVIRERRPRVSAVGGVILWMSAYLFLEAVTH